MSQSALDNLTVMVTRPKPQGEVLCDQIQQSGGHAVFFPTIEIESLTHTADFAKFIAEIPSLDWLIFISPQAVYLTAALIQAHWPHFPAPVRIAALGGGTASALQEMNLPVHAYPQENWESEGLLDLPEFQSMAGQKVALIRGEGGRELLTEKLTQMGTELVHIIAYKRCLPKIDVTHCLSLLVNKKIDIIVTTSNEILQNLTILLGEKAGYHLYTVPLIVISVRMAELAKRLGFQTILFAKNASHHVIMATLKDYLCQMKLKKQ